MKMKIKMKKSERKKLKALMERVLTGATPPSVFSATKDENLLHEFNNCEASYTIHQIKNGFAVVCYNRKHDSNGNVRGSDATVVYAPRLSDLPEVLAANGARHMIGAY